MKTICILLGLQLGPPEADTPVGSSVEPTAATTAGSEDPSQAASESDLDMSSDVADAPPDPAAEQSEPLAAPPPEPPPDEPAAPPASKPTPTRKSLRDGPYHLDLRVQTDFPVAVGARLNAEFPHRMMLSTAVGTLPGSYVDVINAVVVAADGYDDATADVIRSALASSLVWRTHIGWRPLSRRGWYFEGGYGLVTLGGGITGQEAIVLLTGGTDPGGGGGGGMGGGSAALNYDVRSTLHMLDVETGWRWLLWHDRIVLNAAVGFAGTVAAKTTMEPKDTTALTDTAALQALAKEGEDYLDDIYTSYVFTPVVTVGVGYRFF